MIQDGQDVLSSQEGNEIRPSENVQNIFPLQEGQEIVPFQDDVVQFNKFFQKFGIETYMGIFSFTILVVFGICFPTFDVYTDVYFAYDLLQPKCYKYPNKSTYANIHKFVLDKTCTGLEDANGFLCDDGRCIVDLKGKGQPDCANFKKGPSQLWKLDNNTLKNKGGVWMSNEEWNFKIKDDLIYIEIISKTKNFKPKDNLTYTESISKTKVLATTKDGKVIEEDFHEDKGEQLWLKGEPKDEGYFTLVMTAKDDLNTTHLLTAISSSSLEIKDPEEVICTGKKEFNGSKICKSGTCLREVQEIQFCNDLPQCSDDSDESFCDDWKKLIGTTNRSLCDGSNGKFYNHTYFAISMLVPVLLTTIFVIPHWLRHEKPKKRLLKTWPLIVLQVYPQFRMAEILYFGFLKKDRHWESKRDDFQKEIGFLEAMVESIPQTHILLFLAGKEPGLIIGEGSVLFWATFSTSLLSASYALAKFLMTGPIR